MVYLKSAAVGIIAVFIGMILFVLAMMIYFSLVTKRTGEAIGWDPVSFVRSTLGRVIIVVAFVAGFLWEFRRSH